MKTTYNIHPPEARWTHIALRVKDINATIEWYMENTPLSLITRREDEAGYSAWLGHTDNPLSPFLLVLSQFFPDKDPFADAPNTVLGPFAHLGIELPDMESLKEAAEKMQAAGSLVMPVQEMPPPIGWIFMAKDPDGNTLEFSFDQGVYATFQELAE
ncbi:MAG: VOC family protein [Acidimicrobiales bacterium]|nr:VOC family protein [Acidimicrobiales bacterium]